MYICWITDEKPETCFVEYGTDATYGSVERAKIYELEGLKTVDSFGKYTVPLKAYQQIVHLKRLDPNTRYYYKVNNDSEVTQGYDFKTASEPGHPVKFILLSDLQLKDQAPATVKLAGQQGADFIMYNGDLQNTPYKAGEWFSLPGTPEAENLRWFNIMQQTSDGCRLMQYVPIFPSPGNHEIDDQALLNDKNITSRDKLSMMIYLQLFRPLYDNMRSYTLDRRNGYVGNAGANGKHWYSTDYGDLHIVSLAIQRWFAWPAAQAPGWYLFDDIKKGSRQYNWLLYDLQKNRRKYSWVTQHWHMFNRGHETEISFTDPVPSAGNPAVMTYPEDKNYLQRDLRPLFEQYGVNGVSFGHSHVYERYLVNDVNYIEAGSIGNTYRADTDPPCSVQDGGTYCPVADDCRFRSFMLVSIDGKDGMTAQGIQASLEANGIGFVGRVFDSFTVAPAH